jgi:serine/threonine-protein kinase
VPDPPYLPESIALSPDGQRLVYTARIDGTYHLFARRLDGHASVEIPGTEGGQVPFFSPDGRQLGFFAAGQLKRIPVEGGVPDVIVAAPGRVTGAFWAPDGTIVYGTAATGMLMRVEARAGAEPLPVRVNGLEPGIGVHTARPLPGWRSVLATMEDDTEMGKRIVVLDLQTGDWQAVTRGEDGFFVPPDRLMYVHQRRLMLVGFDPQGGATVGDPRMIDLVEPALVTSEGIDRFHAAIANGLLVYPSGTISRSSRILRVSREGEVSETGLTGVAPQVDSTGRRVVACPRDNSVHVLDLVDRTDTPLTFLDTSWYPRWSQDDARIIFADRRRAAFESWSVAPDGTGAPELLFEDQFPNTLTTSVTADGTYMGYVVNPDTNRDIWIRRPGRGFEMILQTSANERVPILSPDGGLFAYVSDENGSDQIFVRDLASLERRWPVTTEGGISPVWSRDGERLFFIRGESIHVVEVRAEGGVRIGQERRVVTQPGLDRDPWGNQTFDAMPDGGLLLSAEEPSDVVLRVVVNWDP